MSKVQPLPKRPEIREANPRIDGMVTAIFALVDGFGLTPCEREQVLKLVSEKLRPIPVPRAGDALNTVVQLIPHNRDWTVKELRDQVEKFGASLTDKEIYNAIGYLTRKQHICRIGMGRYVINGVGFTTVDDFGVEPTITGGDLDD